MAAGLKRVTRSLSALKPHPRNPRVHSENQLAALASAIGEFGFTVPVVIDESDVILAGHGRVAAATAIGLKKVPCVVIAGLTEDQKTAYVLADNRIAEMARWDETMLTDELRSLQDVGFDLGGIGFGKDFLDDLLTEPEAPEEFPAFDENIETQHQCPKCGYEWSGG